MSVGNQPTDVHHWVPSILIKHQQRLNVCLGKECTVTCSAVHAAVEQQGKLDTCGWNCVKWECSRQRRAWLSTQRQGTRAHPHADQTALPALDTQATELSTSPGVDILGDVRSGHRDLQQSSMGWGPELRNYLPVISVGCVWGHTRRKGLEAEPSIR